MRHMLRRLNDSPLDAIVWAFTLRSRLALRAARRDLELAHRR